MTSRLQFARCLMLLLGATFGYGQVRNSGAQTITLNAVLQEGLSVNLSSNAVTFTLTPGSSTNAGNTGVTATTFWNSKAGRTLSVYAYFASSTAALSDSFGDAIPSSDFSISDNGSAYQTLTNTVAYGGAAAGLQLYTTKITGTTKRGSHTDSMLFNINLSALPQLPAGTYTGTLTIQAQAI